MIPIDGPAETAELLAFTRTVEAKSLSRAAAELGVPRATIGRRLARLEERLSARLIRRTTRSLALTDAGDVFYRHARIVLDSLAQAEASIRKSDDAIRGELRVSVPPLNDESFFAMIGSFVEKHPDVRVQVHFSSRLVDLRRDGYDVALRAAAEIEPGLVVRTLARTKLIAVASPRYLAKMGTPRTAKDLRHHRCLMGFARGELPQSSWPVGKGVLHVDGAFSTNDVGLLRDSAVRGLGIALLTDLLVRPLIDRGALVHVLPGIIEGGSRIAVVYPEREFLPPQVRAFVDAIVEWAPALEEIASEKKRKRKKSRSPRAGTSR